ncbi:MAG: hypothetical protein ACR2H2_01285 [Solirubrobacteraceae bacterium]
MTPDTVFHASPRALAGRAERYLVQRPHGEYSDDDVRTIVRRYYATAQAVGLGPPARRGTDGAGDRPSHIVLVAAATSKPGRHRRHRRARRWAELPGLGDRDSGYTGRLLAYSLPPGVENEAQAELIDEALAFRPLPQNRRGVARTLQGLCGTWAADTDYAVKLSRVANEIRSHNV